MSSSASKIDQSTIVYVLLTPQRKGQRKHGSCLPRTKIIFNSQHEHSWVAPSENIFLPGLLSADLQYLRRMCMRYDGRGDYKYDSLSSLPFSSHHHSMSFMPGKAQALDMLGAGVWLKAVLRCCMCEASTSTTDSLHGGKALCSSCRFGLLTSLCIQAPSCLASL
jgi:hypothetical protein